MEKDFSNYIRTFLGNSVSMKPVPTLLKPFIRKDPAVKAFVFDVYGTLLISASGDIDESVFSTDNLNQAFGAAGIQIGESIQDQPALLIKILEEFKQSIREFHSLERTEEIPYPEVDILQIWEGILTAHQKQNHLILNGQACIKCFIFIFEVLSNRIYPMPGMKEMLNQLSESRYPLGIISNAQFYTPVIMNFFLHDTITENEAVLPFDPDLTVFSYKYMRSKPDIFLFELLKDQCSRKYGLFADEILFIGNDMFRDIYPAFLTGFKTALFAGDTKSLRLRQEKPELKKIVPDFIITDLVQLLTIMT
jgi:putative hydrolase of the HAD superfamily